MGTRCEEVHPVVQGMPARFPCEALQMREAGDQVCSQGVPSWFHARAPPGTQKCVCVANEEDLPSRAQALICATVRRYLSCTGDTGILHARSEERPNPSACVNNHKMIKKVRLRSLHASLASTSIERHSSYLSFVELTYLAAQYK